MCLLFCAVCCVLYSLCVTSVCIRQWNVMRTSIKSAPRYQARRRLCATQREHSGKLISGRAQVVALSLVVPLFCGRRACKKRKKNMSRAMKNNTSIAFASPEHVHTEITAQRKTTHTHTQLGWAKKKERERETWAWDKHTNTQQSRQKQQKGRVHVSWDFCVMLSSPRQDSIIQSSKS